MLTTNLSPDPPNLDKDSQAYTNPFSLFKHSDNRPPFNTVS